MELSARADGIYIQDSSGSLAYYYSDIQAGLAAGLQVRCANPGGWGLLNPSGCTLIGAEEQVSYLGSSPKVKSRFLISAQYQNSKAPDSPMLTYTSYMGAVARSCPVGFVLKGPIGYYANLDKAAASEYVSCVWMPTKPSGKFLGKPAMPADADGQCRAESSLVGNPIDAATNNRLEIVTDFESPASPELTWRRTYNSGAFSPGLSPIYTGAVTTTTRLGARWRGSFDRSLSVVKVYDPDTRADVDALELESEDGKTITFQPSGDRYIAEGATSAYIDADEATDGAWRYHAGDGTIEHYDAAGNLRQRRDRNGLLTTLSYESVAFADGSLDTRLSRVTDPRGRSLLFTYDDAGRIATVTLPDGGVLGYAYNEAFDVGREANLSAVTRANGSTVGYLYGEAKLSSGVVGRHLLTGIVGADGKRFASFTYDSSGRATISEHAGGAGKVTVDSAYAGVRSVRDALGNSTTYTFAQVAGAPRLVSRKQPAGAGCPTAASSFRYSDLGQVISRTGVDGQVTTFGYDPQRYLEVERVEAAGTPEARATRTQWDARFDLPVRIDRPGRSETFQYDGRGNLVEAAVSADGASTPQRATRYTYNADGRITRVDGPRDDIDDTVRLSYFHQDAPGCADGGAICPWRKGDLQAIDDALGRRLEVLAYDGSGRITSSRDASGLITSTTFDALGRAVAIELRRDLAGPALATTRLTYDAVGNLASTIDADGVILTYRYDDARRLVGITDGSGNRVDYTLDARGQTTAQAITDAGGQLRFRLNQVFDALGRVQQQTDANGQRITFTYDAAGRPTGSTDPLARSTTQSYDALGRLVRQVEDSKGIAAETRLTYDSHDQVREVTDPKGLATRYQRNGLGDTQSLSSPDTGQTRYDTDAAGQVVRTETADGHVRIMSYDARGRLTRTAYDTDTPITLGWDTAATLCVADEHFAAGRLASMSDGSSRTDYCHDAMGRVTRKVQRTGEVSLTLGYAYTPAGRLAAMTLPDGSRVTYGRNALGQVSDVSVDAGTATMNILHAATWTPFGAITGWTDGVGQSIGRTYGTDGRITAITDSANGGLNLRYTYDARGKLTQLASGATTTTWSYDGIGRLLDAKVGGAVKHAYLWDATGNRLRYTGPAGIQSYTYPADSHRLTAIGTDERSYDAAGHTIAMNGRQFIYNAQGRLAAVKVGVLEPARYTYNGRGERVLRTDDSGDTISLYDEAGHWVGDYDAQGHAKQQVIWLDDLPIAMLANGKVYDIRPDHLGTPRAVIDRLTKQAVWTWPVSGEPFGNDAPNEDPDGDGVAFNFAMRFPGQRYDAAIGINYNYFRDYDAQSGRYVQSDPIGLEGGISTYAYALGSPVDAFDSDGLKVVFASPNSEDARLLRRAYDKVKSTPRGGDMCRALEESSTIYMIDITANGPLRNDPIQAKRDQPSYVDYANNRAWFDPTAKPLMNTTLGLQPASLEAQMAHELGHLSTKVRDIGPGRMDNINMNENPVRKALGEPLRVTYDALP
ncbi:RHS repeat-associated core domain-containing protein [Pinirhizobacter soli]|uniref:RHS repeat-associated core domain-containing protein n=1 Tax=Pinirhizobacter soli TaxID=2786953 RepID=UPI00202AB4F4|nr:RHS repeat-associated core domain-containing protein [Pinirhizobacter soli]